MKQKIILTSLSFSLLLLLGTAVLKSDQEDSKAALAAELLTKLKSSQVKVIAAGHVSGQLALFISGSGSKTDFSGGYQVTVGSDPGDGRFDVDSVEKLAGKYTSFTATDNMFVCSDSGSSSSLVTMDGSNVKALSLDKNNFTTLPIHTGGMSECYESGQIVFASNKPKFYYRLGSSGNMVLYHFEKKTIASSESCSFVETLGRFCKKDAEITISSSCSGSPPSDITAGYVGDSKAYLFDGSNAVYYFDASVFKQDGGQQSVKLTKVPSFQAWFTLASISTANPHELSTTAKGGIAITTIIIIVVVALLILLCVAVGVDVYCKYGKKEEEGDDKGKKKKDKKEKGSKSGSGSGANRKSGQKSSSSQGEGKKKKEKSKSGATPSAKTGTGRRRRGSRRSRPSKSTTVKSKPSGVESKVSNQGERSSSVEGGGGVPTKSPKAKTVAVAPKGKRFSGSNRGKAEGGGGSNRGLKKLPGGKLKSKTGAKVPAVVSGTSPAPTAQAPAVPAAAPVSPPAPAEDPKKAVAPVDASKNVSAAARPRASSSRNRNKSGQMKRKRSSKKRVSSGGRKKSKKRSSEKRKKKRSKSKGGRGHSRRGSKGSRGGGSKSRGGHSKTRTPKGGGGVPQQPKLPGPPGVQADLKMKSLENLGLAGGLGAPKTEQPPPSTSGPQGAPPPPMSVDDVPSDELPPE